MKSEYAATIRPTSGPVTVEIRKLRRAPRLRGVESRRGNEALTDFTRRIESPSPPRFLGDDNVETSW